MKNCFCIVLFCVLAAIISSQEIEMASEAPRSGEPMVELPQSADPEAAVTVPGAIVAGFQPEPAQKSIPIALGELLEINMNSSSGYAYSMGCLGEYFLTHRMSAGMRLFAGNDFTLTTSLEILPFFRFYILDLFAPMNSSGLFAQGDIGMTALISNNEPLFFFNSGISAGYRFAMGKWFVEPELRFGYPVFWGCGVVSGYRF